MKETNQKVIHRLKRIEGQIRGLQKLIENDTYCIDIVTQTSAVKQGLSRIEDIILEEHLNHCAERHTKSEQSLSAKAEILKIYKLKRK